MPSNDPWTQALRQQAAIVQSARLDLDDSRRVNWRVRRAELALQSAEAAYHRLLTDAPRSSVVRHLRERAESVTP